MKHLRIIEEIQRTPWAMTIPSFRAMLSVVEGIDLKDTDHKYFHILQETERDQALDVFGRPIHGAHYASVNTNVGYLMIDGPITPRATVFNDISGMTSLDVLTSDFQKLEANPFIDTIVMLFDSPGGVAQGLSDFNSVVRNSKKKTIAYTWMAASAAYWMASAADEIVSSPDGIVGSIGTVATVRDYRKADEKRGIQTFEIVSTQSPKKRPDPSTPEGRDVIQELVDQFANEFIMAVASNRNTTDEDVLKYYGNGAMVLARNALTAGMIDSIQPADVFAQSVVKKVISYQIPNETYSASAEVNNQPTKVEGTTMNIEKLKAEHRDVFDEVVASAKAEERERIKSIEALADKLDKPLPKVKEAVRAAIDKKKFDQDVTENSMAGELLAVITGAQAQAMEEVANPRREAAQNAKHISNATPKEVEAKNPNAANDEQIERMIAASKAEGRIQ